MTTYLPSLRDAFAPDDSPAHLTYTHNGRRTLSLTHADGAVIGDPILEFVDDALATLDANAEPCCVVEAHGVIQPDPKRGATVELAPLRGQFREIGRGNAMVHALSGHELMVAIDLVRVAEWHGGTTITATPRVELRHHERRLPETLDAAVTRYGRDVATLTRRMGAGPLGEWFLDSGLNRLVLQGHVTVPRQKSG